MRRRGKRRNDSGKGEVENSISLSPFPSDIKNSSRVYSTLLCSIIDISPFVIVFYLSLLRNAKKKIEDRERRKKNVGIVCVFPARRMW